MSRVSRPPGRIAARWARALGAVSAAGLATAPALSADQLLPVPVATIYAGDVIKPTMLREQAYSDSYRPRQPAVDSIAHASGRVARRTLLPGEAIPALAIEDPKLVTRGAPTVIVFEEHGVTISTVGTALGNATVNEAVNVRNTATGRIIQGIVQPDGRVRTGQP